MKSLFSLLILTVLITANSTAQTTYYWNVTSGNWNTLSNWRTDGFGGSVTPSVLPDSTSNIIIGNGASNATVTLNINDTINNLTMQGSGQLNINTSTAKSLYIYGNTTITNSNHTGGGSATMVIAGTSSAKTQQMYGTTNGAGPLPNLKVNCVGTLHLTANITMGGATSFTYTGGTMNADTSTVIFNNANTISGTFTLNNVEFQGNGSSFTVSNTLTVNGYLKTSGSSTCAINTGTINVYGDLKALNTSTTNGGSAKIVLVGSGVQHYSYASGNTLCNLEINQGGGGSVSAATGTTALSVSSFKLTSGDFYAPTKGNLNIGVTSPQNATPTAIFNQTGGTFYPDSGTVVFTPYGGTITYTITVLNTTVFYNVTVNLLSNGGVNYIGVAAGDTVKVSNKLTQTIGAISGGIWLVTGDLAVGSTANWGGGTIIMSGSTNTTYSYSGSSNNGTASLVINKSGYTLSAAGGTSALSVTSFKLIAGTFSAPSGTLYIGETSVQNTTPASIFNQTGGTFTSNSGTVSFNPYGGNDTYTVTVLNTTSFYNVTVNLLSTGTVNYITVTTGDTVQVSGTLTHTVGTISGGVWNLTGNLSVGSSANYGAGTIIMSGSSNTTYSYSGSSSNGTAILCISKSGSATVSAAGGITTLTAAGFKLTSGVFNAPTKGTLNIGQAGPQNSTPTSIFNQTGGTFNADSGTVSFNPYGGSITYTITVLNSTIFYNVTVNLLSTGTVNNITVATGDTVKVSGTLTHTVGTINGGIWYVTGNLSVGSAANFGLGTIIMSGSTNTTYAYGASVSSNGTASLCISKSGGATVSAASGTALSVASFKLTSGTFYAPTSGTLYVGQTAPQNSTPTTLFTLTGGTFNPGSGTVSFNPYGGPVTYTASGINSTVFYNVNVNLLSNGTINTLVGGSGDTLRASNALTLTVGKVNTMPMYIQGNVTVISTFNGGTAPLMFTGANSQTFTLTSATDKFDGKVYLNKSANDVTLASALVLDAGSQTLSFTKGNLITTGSNLLVIGNGVTVNGASDNSYVSGPMKKVGNSAFRFPLGKGGHYKWMAIQAPSSTTDAYTAEYFNQKNSNTALDGVLTFVDSCEYWNLAHNVGSSSVHDTLQWNSPCFYIPNLNYLKVGYVNSSTWTTAGTCTTSGNTTTGKIASPAGTLGDITLAKTNPLVYAHAGSDLGICPGSSTTIGASPAGTGGLGTKTYAWSPSTGLTSSTSANPTANPTATTTYILTVTDSITEYGKDTMVLTVHTNPTAHAGRDTTICLGTHTSIGASPAATGGASPYMYSWSPSAGLSSSTVSQPVFTPTATATYTIGLTVTDYNTCIAKDTISVIVIDSSAYLNSFKRKLRADYQLLAKSLVTLTTNDTFIHIFVDKAKTKPNWGQVAVTFSSLYTLCMSSGFDLRSHLEANLVNNGGSYGDLLRLYQIEDSIVYGTFVFYPRIMMMPLDSDVYNQNSWDHYSCCAVTAPQLSSNDSVPIYWMDGSSMLANMAPGSDLMHRKIWMINSYHFLNLKNTGLKTTLTTYSYPCYCYTDQTDGDGHALCDAGAPTVNGCGEEKGDCSGCTGSCFLAMKFNPFDNCSFLTSDSIRFITAYYPDNNTRKDNSDKLKNLIKAFPNPADNFIQFDLPINVSCDVLVFQADGRVFYSKNVIGSKEKSQINTSNFSNGIYYLRISGNGQTYFTKFAIQH